MLWFFILVCTRLLSLLQPCRALKHSCGINPPVWGCFSVWYKGTVSSATQLLHDLILVTLLHLGGSLHRIELWHPPVNDENVPWDHPKSFYWFQWVQSWVSRAEYCSCQGPSSGQKTPWDNEADRNPLTSCGSDTAKKSPLTNPDDT